MAVLETRWCRNRELPCSGVEVACLRILPLLPGGSFTPRLLVGRRSAVPEYKDPHQSRHQSHELLCQKHAAELAGFFGDKNMMTN